MSSNSSDYLKLLSQGAQLGSFQEQVSRGPYSTSLGTEIAYLQRKVYLPLLPQERLSYGVLKAYDYLAENEMLPESEYHPQGYWFPEDVFADFYLGNFYIPMLFTQLDEYGVKPSEMESTLTKYNAVELDFKGGELATEGHYVKSNYITLKIPKYIAMQFRSTIPKNTKFTVNFVGNNSQPEHIIVTGVVSIGDYEDPWLEREVIYYPGMFEDEEELLEMGDIILNNLEAIEEEEDRRKEECEEFQALENEILGLE